MAVKDGPTNGATVDGTAEDAPKDLDLSVGGPQSARHHIGFAVSEAIGGTVVHSKEVAVGVKRGRTGHQITVGLGFRGMKQQSHGIEAPSWKRRRSGRFDDL